MAHFVRTKNLPYTLSEIHEMTSSCNECLEVKPQFLNSHDAQFVKATQVFERLNIDFKGPLPSVSNNRYILTVIDEYSKFSFAFPCSDMTPNTIIQCLTQLFSIFGMCSYIHSDRWMSFQSQALKSWLHSHGVSTSRTTSYNPKRNGQCERYNGVIWKTILTALKSRQLPTTHWEAVLSDALHSIGSLLCTSINCTPQERMFNHSRRSVNGSTIPSWLKPGPIYVKKHVRNKNDPEAEEADLIEANPTYAHVRFRNGRETTVSIRDTALCVASDVANSETVRNRDEPAVGHGAPPDFCVNDVNNECNNDASNDDVSVISENVSEVSGSNVESSNAPRRSTGPRRTVIRYGAVPYA